MLEYALDKNGINTNKTQRWKCTEKVGIRTKRNNSKQLMYLALISIFSSSLIGRGKSPVTWSRLFLDSNTMNFPRSVLVCNLCKAWSSMEPAVKYLTSALVKLGYARPKVTPVVCYIDFGLCLTVKLNHSSVLISLIGAGTGSRLSSSDSSHLRALISGSHHKLWRAVKKN